jgi:hypothetical protein
LGIEDSFLAASSGATMKPPSWFYQRLPPIWGSVNPHAIGNEMMRKERSRHGQSERGQLVLEEELTASLI